MIILIYNVVLNENLKKTFNPLLLVLSSLFGGRGRCRTYYNSGTYVHFCYVSEAAFVSTVYPTPQKIKYPNKYRPAINNSITSAFTVKP